MKIICHKISKNHPNSIYGLIDNIKKGFKSFELDINTCIDEVILYHDNYFNGRHLKKLYKNDFIYNGKYCVNTFIEFINVLNNYNDLNIFFDIKGNDTNIINYICYMYPRFNTNNNYYFQSFNYKFIKKIKKMNNSIKCGLLIDGHIPLSKKILKNIDYLCILEDFYLYFVDYNKDIYLWNVNYNNYYNCFIENNIKGIITDYPELFYQ